MWIGDNGWFQNLVAGNTDNSFFPPHEPQTTNTSANAGLALAFPSGQASLPSTVNGKVWGWTPNANGPSFSGGSFDPVVQSNWIGSGTDADPFSQVTTYQVPPQVGFGLLVTQTTTYINGASNFVITYSITNNSVVPVRFRALVGADVYLNGSDCGVGIFKPGPPRFLGGSNLGRVGGFTEAGAPSPAWTHYFEGPYGGPPGPCETNPTGSPGVWDYIQGAPAGSGFPDTVSGASVDNGIGVQWDTYFASGLAPGATSVPFQLNTLGTVPGELRLSPSIQFGTAGTQAAVTATATDSSGAAAGGILLRFSTSGANSAGGTATTNSAGQARIAYTPTRAGNDTISVFEDIDRNGVRGQGEPRASATVAVSGSGSVGSSDRTAPRLTVSASRKMKRKRFAKGVTVLSKVDEASSLRLELRVPGRKRHGKRKIVRLASQSLPVAGAGTRASRLRPSKRRMRSMPKRATVTLRVTATDRAGNRTVVSKKIRVR